MIDLVIVGSGPAGLGAAISAAENGLEVYVLDEFVKPGGRLLGQLHEEPDGKWVNGIAEAQKLYERAIQLEVNILCGVSVYDLIKLDNGWCVYTTDKAIESKCLLLATGASETPIPVPGWTLPGVMSIGAAQVMGNLGGHLPSGTGQENLATAQGEGMGRAQARLQLLALGLGQGTHKKGSFHTPDDNT
jgi:sarcosine oxidase, subunit alpha